MATIDEKIIITGDTTALRRALTTARDDMVKFGAASGNAAASVAKGFIAATAALETIKVAFNEIKAGTIGSFTEFVEAGDTIGMFATRTGIATDELQRLAFIAQQTDTELGPLVEGLTKLARNAAEAASGNKGLADAFASLGVNVTDANGQLRSRTDLLQDVATATGELGTAEDRTAALTAVMGKSAEQFAGVMEALADSSQAVSAAFDKFIVPIDAKDIALAGELDNIFKRIDSQLANARQRAAALIAPEVAALAEQFSEALLEAQRSGSTLQQLFAAIGRQLEGVAVTLEFWRDTAYDVARAIGLVTEASDKANEAGERQQSIAEMITLAVARGRDVWQGIFSLIETTGLRVLNLYLAAYEKLLQTIVQVGGAFSESIVKPAADAAVALRAQIAANEQTIANSSIGLTDTANADAARAQIEASRADFEKRKAELQAKLDAAANKGGDKKTGTFRKAQGDEESAAMKAADDARLKLIQDARKRELAALERAYSDQLVTTADYYRKRRDIDQAGIDEEIAMNERAQSRTKQQIAQASTAGEKNKGRAELSKLQAEGEILRRESVTQTELLEREQRRAYEQYNERITAVIAELATAQGAELEVEFARVETQLNARLKDAIQNGDTIGQAAIEQLRTINAARLDAARIERDLQTQAISTQSKRATLDIQHERGLLTTLEYEQQIFELENETLKIEQSRLKARIALAEASGDELEAERLRTLLADLETGFDRLTDEQLRFQQTFKSTFSQFFADTVKGVDDTETRLRNLISGFFDSFLQTATDNMAEQLYKAIVTPVQQGTADAQAPVQGFADSIVSILGEAFSKVGGWWSSLFSASGALPGVTGSTNTSGIMDSGSYGQTSGGGFASGGPVSGPGSNISDSIVANLSDGEFVQPARAVGHYGESVMQAIRTLAIPRSALIAMTSNAGYGLRDPQSRRFADGGLVGASAQSPGIGTPSVVIENRGTPQRVRSIESEGADATTVIRIITEDIRNNGAASQAIAGAFRLNR
ncbi:MAG: hypothetical protein ACOYB0_08245 [Polynucleobacter sp.]